LSAKLQESMSCRILQPVKSCNSNPQRVRRHPASPQTPPAPRKRYRGSQIPKLSKYECWSLRGTAFDTPEFFDLDYADQSAIILEAPIDDLKSAALTTLATILLRTFGCECNLFEAAVDELSGEVRIIERRKHDYNCVRVRRPITEDLSEYKLRLRKRHEMLVTESYLLSQEELMASGAVRASIETKHYQNE